VLQTIPSLALFGFLIPLLGRYGIGRLPARTPPRAGGRLLTATTS